MYKQARSGWINQGKNIEGLPPSLLLPPPLSFAGCVNIHGEQKFRTPSRPHPASRGRKRLNKYFPWETFLCPFSALIFFKYFYRINICICIYIYSFVEHEGHCKSTAIDLRRFVSADLRTYLRAIETRDPGVIEDR